MKVADLLRDLRFPGPEEDRHWLVSCLIGAATVGIFWVGIDRVRQLDRPGGLLAPLGWSVTSLLVCVAIGGAVGLLAGWSAKVYRRRHAQGIMTMAGSMGFSYTGECKPSQGTPEAEKAIRRLLSPSAMGELAKYAGWWVECRDGRLALQRGRGFRPPKERPQLVDEALAIRSVLMKTNCAT